MFVVVSENPVGIARAAVEGERVADFTAGSKCSDTRFFGWSGAGPFNELCACGDRVAFATGVIHERTPHAWQSSANRLQPGRVLDALTAEGLPALGRFCGKFGVVTWDATSGELLAFRDPLGVYPLFYAQTDRELRVSDNLDAFGETSAYDRSFIAEFMATRGACVTRTVWRGVRPIPAGQVLAWDSRGLRFHTVRPPGEGRTSVFSDGGEAAQAFRQLLEDAVLAEVEPGGATWAQLSGGLDSSSVVSVAARAHLEGRCDRRLGGTLTLVDSLGNGDETPFVEDVVQSYSVINQRIVDDWPWRRDGEPTPVTDQPSRDYPFWARDRLIGRILRTHGATSLLSGIGPDHYLATTSAHIPDLFWNGRFREAAQELYRWAYSTRDTVLRTAYQQVLIPLCAPRVATRHEAHESTAVKCLTKRFCREEYAEVSLAQQSTGRSRGAYYAAETERALRRIGTWVPTWFRIPGIDIRHPFLSMPLVEWCIQLPYSLRTDVYRSKPVLRAAMHGILPERVRLRTTKGSVLEPRFCWAFARERDFFTTLLASPVLADLGCIEPRQVLDAIDTCGQAGGSDASFLYTMLSLETWLSAKSGRCVTNNSSAVEMESTP